MCTLKKRSSKYVLPLLLPVLFSVPAITLEIRGAAQPTYTVTETQLTELETVFETLKDQQKRQTTLLTQQQTQIETLKKQLTASETALTLSKIQSQKAAMQLAEANRYLEKYENSVKKTNTRRKRQKAVWAAVAGIAVVYAATK